MVAGFLFWMFFFFLWCGFFLWFFSFWFSFWFVGFFCAFVLFAVWCIGTKGVVSCSGGVCVSPYLFLCEEYLSELCVVFDFSILLQFNGT